MGSYSTSLDSDMFEISSFLSLIPNADILVSPTAPVFASSFVILTALAAVAMGSALIGEHSCSASSSILSSGCCYYPRFGVSRVEFF